MSAPILITCEGSHDPGNRLLSGLHCQMCHKRFPGYLNETPDHQRDDILARLQRGDFD